MSETTRWFKDRAPTISRGSSAMFVAAFIATTDVATHIIDDGINGKPMNHWVAVKFLFLFVVAAVHANSVYTDSTHEQWKREFKEKQRLSESEFFRQQAGPQPPKP